MKNAYEQIVENMQTRTCTHSNGIPLRTVTISARHGQKFVKQSESGGTFLHKAWSITAFPGGKTPYSGPGNCERNEYIKIDIISSGPGREQTIRYPVFNMKHVIKKFSRTGFD
jgi:hypothetical protein